MTLPDTYSPEEKKELDRQFNELLKCWKSRKDEQDVAQVTEAYLLAANAHKDARRRSGEPYMYHPLAVAMIIAGEMGMGRTSIIGALLHDVVEDTEYSVEDIRARFGDKVAEIVDGVTKLTNDDFNGDGVRSLQAETFRKVIMSMSNEMRVVLVKLADRLHNMRTLDSMPHHKQLKIASETTQIYAPLAYRLGLYKIKVELDDLCLKYIRPQVFETVRRQLEGLRETKVKELEEFIAPVKKELHEMGIKVRTMTIERNISAVWERMNKFGMSIDEVYDVYVSRIIIDCPKNEEKVRCWETYAVLTDFYYPDSKKLRDWVSFPKTNGYSSIHGVFMGKRGNWIETQIRTERMDDIAENGFSAYWRYRDKNTTEESGLDLWMGVVKDLVKESDKNNLNALEFIDNFQLDLFSDEIFVFTPKGDKVTLPKGATVLDFAYGIHSELGNHCIGANVNKKLARLDTELKMGDQVEIITSQHQEPQEKWFVFLSTSIAKSKLKSSIKDYRRTFKEEGKEKLHQMFNKLGIEFSKQNRSALTEKLNMMSRNDLYYYVAIGKVGLQVVENAFKKNDSNWSDNIVKYLTLGIVRPASNKNSGERAAYTIATCCKPIPGDDVVAIELPGEPVQIHHPDCQRAMKLMSRFGQNIVKAKWQFGNEFSFLATVKVFGINKMGLGAALFDVLTNKEHLDVHSLEMKSEGGMVIATISVYVDNLKRLESLIEQLKKIDYVRKVERIGNA